MIDIPAPYQHQVIAVQKAREWNDIALLWECGTGKTRGVIDIIRDKFNANKRIMRTLILGPVAVIYNWKNEIAKYSKIDVNNHVFVLPDTRRSERLTERLYSPVNKKLIDYNGIVIMNYEALLNEYVFELLEEWQPEIIACDESHMLKNPKAKRSKNVAKLAKKASSRIIMTGTPILQNSMDIYMQYLILDGGKTFGTNFYVFQSSYFKDLNAGWKGNKAYFPKLVPIPERQADLSAKIYSKALRVTKEECLDLPPRVEQKVYVPLSAEQAKMYNTMKRDYIAFLDSPENKEKPIAIVAQLAVTRALRLQQIVCGFVKDDMGVEHEFEDIPRLKQLRDLLEEICPKYKCIIWCSFILNYKQVAKVCDVLGLKYVFITGDQDSKEKQSSVDDFQNDSTISVCIANRRAGGTGINLTAAPYSITYSKNFNLAEELQSRDRNHRGGSQIHEQIVKIDLISKDTIDELCTLALENKENISQTILSWRDKL